MKIIELRKNGKIGNNKTLTLLSTDKRWQQISWSCELDMRNTQRRHAGQGVGRSGNNQCDGRVIIEDFCSWWGWPWWWSSWLKSWLSTCSWWGGQRGQQWDRQCQTSSPPPSPLSPPPCDQQAFFESLMSKACQKKRQMRAYYIFVMFLMSLRNVFTSPPLPPTGETRSWDPSTSHFCRNSNISNL